MQQQIPNNTGVVKDEISLKEVILSVQAWWKYMLNKWKVIVLAGVIGGVLGLVYSLLNKTTYRASSTFILEKSKSSAGGIASLAVKFGLGGPGGADQGLFTDEDNITAFMKSNNMGRRTLLSPVKPDSRELLIERYLTIYEFKEKWKGTKLEHIKFNAYPDSNSLVADSVTNFVLKRLLEKNIVIDKAYKETNILSVTVTSPDEEFSKSYTETLINNTADFYMKTVTKKVESNVAILSNQADSILQLINYSIVGAARTLDAIPNLNPAYQRLKVPSQKNTIDVEMNKAILEQIVGNLELAKIELRKETPLFQIIDRPILPLERVKVGKVKSILFGGVIFGLIAFIFMSIKYFYRQLMK